MRRTTVALVSVAVLAGCAGGGGQAISSSALPSLVLQPSDLPSAFERFDTGRLIRPDMSPPRDDPMRFGREGGWKARYRRPGSPSTRGPLVVQSTVDVFGSAGGAGKDLGLYRSQFDEAVASAGAKLVAAPTIGSDSHAMVLRRPGAARPVLFFTLAWREHNATASLLVEGFEGRVSLEDAVALARKQERRVASARSEPRRALALRNL